MRETAHPLDGRHPLARMAILTALACLALAALLVAAGCTAGQGTNAGSSETTPVTGSHMAGPAAEVHVSQAAVNDTPEPWNLKTPESAVRSYLDWTSYAFRIGQSQFATPTMSPTEEVQVDSYVQYNIQKKRLIDQTLLSIAFGKPSVGATRTLVPAKEQWTYSYLSIDTGNGVLAGPYTAAYDSTYTVVKVAGRWVVDSVKATPKGTLK